MFSITSKGVFIGHPNAWSDWSLHISLVNIFANKPINEWFLYHPYYANGKLTYGFLVHLLTGLLMKTGIQITTAFFIISFILLVLFLLGIYALYYKLSGSQKQSLLAIFIFFTSSGMGVFRFISKIKLSEVTAPTQDFTKFLEYDWLAGNIPAAMLIPQRAFLIGVTIGVWVLFLLLNALDQPKKKFRLQKKILALTGVLAGILPIAHMHSFIAIVILSGTIIFSKLYAAKNKKNFIYQVLYFVIPATLISNLLFFSFIFGGIEVTPFMSISLGWTAKGTLYQWAGMWLKLWGTFIPLVVLATWKYKLNQSFYKNNLAITLVGFLLIFVLANIVIFQPTPWDNTKLFAWVYLGFSILVAKLLHYFWRISKNFKIITILLLITLSSSGVIELLRLANFSNNTYLLTSRSDLELAEEIKENTQTDAIFLTGMIHNHPIPLWANRPMYLGYLGWVKNFGFNHLEREKITYAIFQGKSQAIQLIKENEISYIYVSRRETALKPNMEFLQSFPVAFQNEDTTVYDTRNLWQQ